MSRLGITLFALLLLSCAGSETFIDRDNRDWQDVPPPPETDLVYSVHLIGDAGSPSLERQEPVLKLFQKFLSESSENSAAIFLGDNIYLNGLPDSTHPNRDFYEARIIEQLKTLNEFEGRVVFIPGNHDWDDGGPDGLSAIKRQENFIENYLNRGNTFLPDDGFPGPVEIKLMDEDDDPRLEQDIHLVALDTQWWLHQHEKPYGDNGEFEVTGPGDVLNELEDIVRDRKNDYLIVAGHHPLVSKDRHGGYFPAKRHLLPPIGGSLYVLYRKLFGYPQDLTHHRYRDMIDGITDVLHQKEEVIYVSGHAHGIQYNKRVRSKRNSIHHIVSGSGSKTSFIASGRGAEFNYGSEGFVRLNIYADGTVWMDAWAPVGDGSKGKLLFRTQVQGPYGDPLTEPQEELQDISYADSTVTMAANPDYNKAGPIKKFLAGSNRRELWDIESEFPVFDVTEVEGGLEVVRSGGKGQSNTLHLDGEDDKEYVLRSVDKEAGKIWDEDLRNTVAKEIAQDQFSMLDPFAALVVAELAKAAKVFHVKPEIYVVPDDPKLGAYGDEMAGTLALFERKPDNDMSDVNSVENADDVMGWFDMIREVEGDIDHRVDQKLMARSRLFDMLIGDWDRHYDQWRWAAVEPDDEQGKIYKPIPRDRDVALMKLNGVIPTLAKILGPFYQYQNTEDSYGNFKGLNFNSLDLTRRFTNQLTKEDWLEIARDLKNQLTDESIEQAVRAYPPEVFKVHGEEMIHILKKRRDQLIEKAGDYYGLIDGVVSVPASHKREQFVIEIPHKDTVIVKVNKLAGDGELRENYYSRTFSKDETDEIRLYGLGDDDRFIIKGTARNRIRIRIVGGAGNDEYIDQNPGQKRKISIYDTPGDNTFETAKRTSVKLSEDPSIHEYSLSGDYRWNTTLFKFYFNYNQNDGMFLGGGPMFVRNGFRKKPSDTHYFRGNLAPLTGAANLRYNGQWYSLFGDWDLQARANVLLPGSYTYFFGLGNETLRSERRNIDYYRGVLWQYDLSADLELELNEFLTISGGSGILFTDVRDITGDENILTDPQAGVNPNIFNDQLYSKVAFSAELDGLDDHQNPLRGIHLNVHSNTFVGLYESSRSHSNFSGALRFYLSPQTKRQITFASRIGGQHLVGAFPFYQSNSIGGSTNLRGFDNRRFSGRSSLYSNNELRIELFDFYDYYLFGRLGITSFFDAGRVWTDNEDSSLIHTGYGGGIWFNLFDAFLVSSYYGKSSESHSFMIRAGFFF